MKAAHAAADLSAELEQLEPDGRDGAARRTRFELQGRRRPGASPPDSCGGYRRHARRQRGRVRATAPREFSSFEGEHTGGHLAAAVADRARWPSDWIFAHSMRVTLVRLISTLSGSSAVLKTGFARLDFKADPIRSAQDDRVDQAVGRRFPPCLDREAELAWRSCRKLSASLIHQGIAHAGVLQHACQ